MRDGRGWHGYYEQKETKETKSVGSVGKITLFSSLPFVQNLLRRQNRQATLLQHVKQWVKRAWLHRT